LDVGMAQTSPFSSSGPAEPTLIQPPSPSLRFASFSPSCPLVATVDPKQALDDVVCSLPKVDDKDLAPEVLLHIAYEVVSQLDMAEAFRSLSLEEQSLCGFLGR
jgi:hypothetical protein